MICFYHNDMDGKCAGAIVRLVHPRCRMYSINYNSEFPFDLISPRETVYIVDFSLQKPGDFEKLLEITDKVIWIDHHKTAIDRHEKFDQDIQGIRNTSESGCELTWKYLFGDTEPPDAVTLIGDRDTWRWQFGKQTKYFHAGIQIEDTNPTSALWRCLLPMPGMDRTDARAKVQKILVVGATVEEYRAQAAKDYLKAWGFEVSFEGYRGIAVNVGMCGSDYFDSVQGEEYDLMLPFVFDGRLHTVSIYTNKDGIDCAKLAKKRGGGGHTQAAGFQCEELPFVTLVRKEKNEDL